MAPTQNVLYLVILYQEDKINQHFFKIFCVINIAFYGMFDYDLFINVFLTFPYINTVLLIILFHPTTAYGIMK